MWRGNKFAKTRFRASFPDLHPCARSVGHHLISFQYRQASILQSNVAFEEYYSVSRQQWKLSCFESSRTFLLERQSPIVPSASKIQKASFNKLNSQSHKYHTVFSSRRILCEYWLSADVKKEGPLE